MTDMNFNIISPKTQEELLRALRYNQDKNFRFGAGYTDLILELKKQPANDLTVINLAQLQDNRFTSITIIDGGLSIGALTTANSIVRSSLIREKYPVLGQAALQHGSRQVRQTATVGGNLCTASPAGDMACALVALQAQCEILSAEGNVRIIPIDIFFSGVRKTDLKKNEILRSIILPADYANGNIYSHFIKVGLRRSMECSIVSLAYHIIADSANKVIKCAAAIGSAAPTIKFCKEACEYLKGKTLNNISPEEAKKFAALIVEYASPISDIRASAWYRKQVLFNISQGIFDNFNSKV